MTVADQKLEMLHIRFKRRMSRSCLDGSTRGPLLHAVFSNITSADLVVMVRMLIPLFSAKPKDRCSILAEDKTCWDVPKPTVRSLPKRACICIACCVIQVHAAMKAHSFCRPLLPHRLHLFTLHLGSSYLSRAYRLLPSPLLQAFTLVSCLAFQFQASETQPLASHRYTV